MALCSHIEKVVSVLVYHLLTPLSFMNLTIFIAEKKGRNTELSKMSFILFRSLFNPLAVLCYLRQLLDPMTGGLKALYDLKQRGQVKAIGIGCNGSEAGSIEVCKGVSNAAKELDKMCNKEYKALDYILCAGPCNLLNHDN